MDRSRVPTEFGFTTPSYIPPERARPAWKTLLFGGLLSLLPLVGSALGAVYIDRRHIPSTYDVADAIKTALLQIVAVGVLLLVVWIVFGMLLGFSIQVNPQIARSGP